MNVVMYKFESFWLYVLEYFSKMNSKTYFKLSERVYRDRRIQRDLKTLREIQPNIREMARLKVEAGKEVSSVKDICLGIKMMSIPMELKNKV